MPGVDSGRANLLLNEPWRLARNPGVACVPGAGITKLPVGGPRQGPILNGAVLVETSLPRRMLPRASNLSATWALRSGRWARERSN